MDFHRYFKLLLLFMGFVVLLFFRGTRTKTWVFKGRFFCFIDLHEVIRIVHIQLHTSTISKGDYRYMQYIAGCFCFVVVVVVVVFC